MTSRGCVGCQRGGWRESICRGESRHLRGSALLLVMKRMESGAGLRIRTLGTSLCEGRHALAREGGTLEGEGMTDRKGGLFGWLYTRGVSCLGGVCHCGNVGEWVAGGEQGRMYAGERWFGGHNGR